MSIRITNKSIITQVITDINKNMRTLQEIQYKLSTGYKINRPSDDPGGVIDSIKIRDSIDKITQRKLNIIDGKARLSATSSALERCENLILQIQILAADAGGSTASSALRPAIANEIDGLLNEVLLNANAKFLGKYIFGGHESLTAPYEATLDTSGNVISVVRHRILSGSGDEIKGIDDRIYHNVAEGLDLQINISGSAPFMPNGEGGVDDIFSIIINLRDNVLNNDISAIENSIRDIDGAFKNIINQNAVVGNRLNRMESVRANNEQIDLLHQENLSEILNVDYVKAITELNYQQFILENSLQVGARIIPPSLLDFI